MILADTSVWVDHLRRGDAKLLELLENSTVLQHPFVVGEIACGNLAHRSQVLDLLQNLPMATVAQDDEVMGFITRHRLYGKGIGYIDAHLLASVTLTPDCLFWTRDKRLLSAAHSLKCSWRESSLH